MVYVLVLLNIGASYKDCFLYHISWLYFFVWSVSCTVSLFQYSRSEFFSFDQWNCETAGQYSVNSNNLLVGLEYFARTAPSVKDCQWEKYHLLFEDYSSDLFIISSIPKFQFSPQNWNGACLDKMFSNPLVKSKIALSEFSTMVLVGPCRIS